MERREQVLRLLTWAALVGVIPWFFVHSFRRGWREVQTDFPNYHTAAVLARRHAPVEQYYDWPWFQRQMNYAGWGGQLGGYIPQTPLTMLPMLPLAGLAPMEAKRVWLVLSLVFLAGAVWLLGLAAGIEAPMLLLLTFAGYASLHTNFLLGQYYVLLLFLLTAAVLCLVRCREAAGGMLLGVVCMLKLYTLPFCVYFAWKRQWRALAGMAGACAVLGAVSVAWFGWHGNLYFFEAVLPRAMGGSILDPYNAGTGTMTQLLGHLFVREVELNPRPLVDAPFLFEFLRLMLTLGVFVLTVMALRRERSEEEGRDLGFFLLGLFLITPNLASYAMVLLLVPVALVIRGTDWRRVALAIAVYVLLCAPPRPWWMAFYPRVWLIAALYVAIGSKYWGELRWKQVMAAMAGVCFIALTGAWFEKSADEKAPPAKWNAFAPEAGTIYASNPAASTESVVYEEIEGGRYVLKRIAGGDSELLRFDGQAFHPSVPAAGGPLIYFELVTDGHSRIVCYNRETRGFSYVSPEELDGTKPAVSQDGRRVAFLSHGGLMVAQDRAVRRVRAPGPVTDVSWFPDGERLAVAAGGQGAGRIFRVDLGSGSYGELTSGPDDAREPAVSPDGARLAFAETREGVRQVWVEELVGRKARAWTEGSCNSFAPAWQADSKHVIFASDCRRGFGLPALYRAE